MEELSNLGPDIVPDPVDVDEVATGELGQVGVQLLVKLPGIRVPLRRSRHLKSWTTKVSFQSRLCTVYPRIFDPIFIISYYINRVKTSWTDSV